MQTALLRGHKTCTHGDAFGPKGQCSSQSPAISKSSGRDNRYVHAVHKTWNQHKIRNRSSVSGCLITRANQGIRAVFLSAFRMAVGHHGRKNLSTVLVHFPNNPVSFSKGKINDRDLFFQKHPCIFCSTGKKQSGIGAEWLVGNTSYLPNRFSGRLRI